MITEDDIPIIPNTELDRFPFRCLAAIAYRALIRSLEVLERGHLEKLDSASLEMVNHLIDLLRKLAESPPSVTEATTVIPWDMLGDFKKQLDKVPFSTQRRAVFLASCDATRVYGRKVNSVVGWSIQMYPENASDQKQLLFQFQLARPAYADFAHLRDGLESGNVQNSTAILREMLGDIWHGSEPDWRHFQTPRKQRTGRTKR
jgi:hypothetical protein